MEQRGTEEAPPLLVTYVYGKRMNWFHVRCVPNRMWIQFLPIKWTLLWWWWRTPMSAVCVLNILKVLEKSHQKRLNRVTRMQNAKQISQLHHINGQLPIWFIEKQKPRNLHTSLYNLRLNLIAQTNQLIYLPQRVHNVRCTVHTAYLCSILQTCHVRCTRADM